MWYLAISDKDLSTYGSSNLAIYAHVTVNSDKSFCVLRQTSKMRVVVMPKVYLYDLSSNGCC